MSGDNLTVHILREIRDDVRSVSQRLDQHIESTDRRFDAVDRRFDSIEQHLERLERGQANLVTKDELLASELRTATRHTELTASNRNLHDFLEKNQRLRDRVERCEQDIADLKGRVH